MEHAGKDFSEPFGEDLKNISERLRSKRERAEDAERGGESAEKAADLEAIRESLHEMYVAAGDDSTARSIPPRTKVAQKTHYLDGIDDEETRTTVNQLVQKTVSDGVAPVIEKVVKSRDNYLIDVFHGALVNFIHKKMQEQGLL